MLVYIFALAMGIYALIMIYSKEREIVFDKPEKLLIVAPHQDDCVICAGGFGIANVRLGGETHIVFLSHESKEDLADIRRREAEESWGLVGSCNLYHMDILPQKCEKSYKKIYDTADRIQTLIDQIQPTMLFIPLFEGGHVQHDITNYVISYLVKKPNGLRIFECPEYSPYFSFIHTPHKVLGILSRFFLVFVSYFGPPEGLDRRTMFNLKMSDYELALKKKMLSTFRSQGGDSLVTRFGYPDRVIEWVEKPYKSSPFAYKYSLAYFLQLLRQTPLAWLVKRLFPWEYKSVGLTHGITDMNDELSNIS